MSKDLGKYLNRKAPTVKQFGDVYAKQGVQIEVRQDGGTVWINVDGVCALRIFNPDEKLIEIEDKRK